MADFLTDINPGDLATWATALVALLALVAATWAGVTSHRMLKVEQKREDRAEMLEQERRGNEARAAQANLVAWWPAQHQYGSLVVRNGSQIPIYDVGFTLTQASDPMPVYTDVVAVMPPDHEQLIEYPEELAYARSDDGLGNFELVPLETLHQWVVSLHFRDAAGRGWIRHADGWLESTGTKSR